MASSKRIGFYWGEEKLTIVEFEKNIPLQVVSLPLSTKANISSPFSSSLTEEIQITTVLKKMLQDSQITAGSFYVSLPMKEIILRSFIIPFVKQDNIQSAIKFEAKKYIPFDIQDLSYVFHTIPFAEGQTKRLQVIFFAARKEVWARYERIFQQVKIVVSYSEPYIVSLSKALLFRKEIKPTDHIAFLILDKSLGRICFIDRGIPQFIREFPIGSASSTEGDNESLEALNLKIATEVLNSFDFYSRQFNGERIEQVLVSSEFAQKDLLDTLETELKLKIVKFSPVITTPHGQSNDMDAIYAMGACVAPPMDSLKAFNFLGEVPKAKFENDLLSAVMPYKDTILGFLLCTFFLIGVNVFFQTQLKSLQKQYDQVVATEGQFSNVTQDVIQSIVQQNTDMLNQYKNVRTRSDMSKIILLIAARLPQGVLLTSLSIIYNQGDTAGAHVTIDMKGDIATDDPSQQIAMVNQVYSDFKNDKDLSPYISSVTLVSFNPETYNGRQATGFSIHCT